MDREVGGSSFSRAIGLSVLECPSVLTGGYTPVDIYPRDTGLRFFIMKKPDMGRGTVIKRKWYGLASEWCSLM